MISYFAALCVDIGVGNLSAAAASREASGLRAAL